MKIITNLIIGSLLFGFFLFASRTHADAPFLVSGGRVSSNGENSAIILIGTGVGVGAVALVSWFVIRAIRKKDVINK